MALSPNDQAARPQRGWPGLVAAGLLSAVLSWSGLAAAQGADGQVFKDWRLQCQDNAQAPNGRFCTIVHAMKDQKTDQTVAQLNIGYPLGQQAPTAVATVPLAVRLPPGLGIRIDNSAVKTFPYEFCTQGGCQAQIHLDATMVANLKAGSGGHLIIQLPSGETATIAFSLSGFTAAFAALQ